jgi:hypothetical protein
LLTTRNPPPPNPLPTLFSTAVVDDFTARKLQRQTASADRCKHEGGVGSEGRVRQ